MYIEFETEQRMPTEQEANFRDPNKPYFVAKQEALLFVEGGSKHPDKFEFRLARTLDANEANAARPMPAGKYELKDSAFGVSGFKNINCDFSELTPMKNQQAHKAA